MLKIKPQWDDSFDKWAFFIPIIVGVVGICFFKYYLFSQYWTTIYPVVIMLLYTAFLIYSRRGQLREDQSGDNLYYLGFLYTLTSLSFALYQFGGEGGTKEIIGSFGIALATTIVGLTLRVVFNQMRHDPVETEIEARLELANAATRLRTDLLDVTRIMKSTLIAAQQQTAEVVLDYGKKFDEIASSIIEKTASSHNEFLENTKRLNQATTKLVKGVETLITRIDSIEPPENFLEDKLDPAIKSIREAAEAIVDKARADEEKTVTLSKLIQEAVNASLHLDSRINLLAGEGNKAIEVMTRLAEVSQQFTRAGNQFESASSSVARFGEEQKRLQEEIGALMVSTTEQAGQSMGTLQETVASVVKDIQATSVIIVKEATESIKSSVDIQKSAIHELELSLKELVGSSKVHNEALSIELSRSRDYTEKVHRSLLSLTESLTENLSKESLSIATSVGG